jgi:hypothetical protein
MDVEKGSFRKDWNRLMHQVIKNYQRIKGD